MSIDRLHEPVQIAITLALAAAGITGSLALWVSVKLETRASWRSLQSLRLSMETRIKDLEARVEELQSAPPYGPNPPALTTVQSMNLTLRAKALRMHSRGETVPRIAAALGVPREEVDLLLKLERMIEARVA
jgi:hypothetical protein